MSRANAELVAETGSCLPTGIFIADCSHLLCVRLPNTGLLCTIYSLERKKIQIGSLKTFIHISMHRSYFFKHFLGGNSNWAHFEAIAGENFIFQIFKNLTNCGRLLIILLICLQK